jgi:hypothetical protein
LLEFKPKAFLGYAPPEGPLRAGCVFENDHDSSVGALASCGHLLHGEHAVALIIGLKSMRHGILLSLATQSVQFNIGRRSSCSARSSMR